MAVTSSPPATETVTLTIDGNELTVPVGTAIWTAARDAGIEIPVLCHDERYDPVGECRPRRTSLTELMDSGGGAEHVDDRITELEKTMRLTSIGGLGQVALGPVVSVLGLDRGGTEPRPQPRSENEPESN